MSKRLVLFLSAALVLPCAAQQNTGAAGAMHGARAAAEDLYYAASNDDWNAASGRLQDLRNAAGTISKGAPSPLLGNLQSRLQTLSATIERQDRLPTMQYANEVTFVLDSLAAPAGADVRQLGYFGRAMEVNAEAYQLEQLQFLTKELKQMWEKARPQVVAKGGATQAAQLEKAIGQLGTAESLADFENAVQAVSTAAGNIEGLFGIHSRRGTYKKSGETALNAGPHRNQPPVDGAAEPLNNDRNFVRH